MATFVTIRPRITINMDQVAYISPNWDEKEITITFAFICETSITENMHESVPHEITLKGDDALNLMDWLDHHAPYNYQT